MIPAPGQTLRDLATRIATDLLPSLSTPFSQADAGLITGLLMTMAEDYERAVDNRMRDIAEMRALFEETAANKPADIPGSDARAAFLHQAPASFHLADVTALHAEGFTLLIELHAWAEDAHETELEEAIWALLRTHSERNKFELPNF